MRSQLGHALACIVPSSLLLLAACSSGSSGTPAPANLTYSDAAAVYETCSAISANVPSIGGGAVTSYAVTPALPSGLSLDAATGVISGTPTEAIAATTFTITAANSSGETTFDVSIEVDSSLASGISYGDTSLSNLAEVEVHWMPTIESGSADLWTIESGTLPTGLTLDADTGEISGTPTFPGTSSVTIGASNCEGEPATIELELTIESWFPSSMYVTNNFGGGSGATISSALWDDALGGLRPTGWSPADGGVLAAPTLHPDGEVLFVADNSGGILQFDLDGSNGRLAATSTVTPLSQTPTDLAITPDGAFLYASCPDGNVYMFAVDANDHSLSALSPPSIATGSSPARVAVDPTGSWLVVLDDADDDLETFVIDGTTGDLTAAGAISSGADPLNVSIAPSGSFVYVTTSTSAEIRGFAIDAETGALTAAANSPFATASVVGCVDLVFDPSGVHAYAPSALVGEVVQYDVDATTGELALMATNSVLVEDAARGVAIDPRGERLYVTMSNDRIQVLAIGDDGSLALDEQPVLQIRPGATDIVFSTSVTPRRLVSDALYAVSFTDDTIYNFDLADGLLAPMAVPSTSNGSDAIEGLSLLWMSGRVYDMEPEFNYGNPPPGGFPLYSMYSIGSETHELQYETWSGLLCPTRDLIVDTSERFGFGLCDSGIVETTFDVDGTWIVGTTVPLGDAPDDAVVHPGGALFFATDPAADQLRSFWIDPITGVLTGADSPSTAGNPVEALVTPSGRFVYAVCRAGTAIDAFSIDMTGGALTPLTASTIAIQTDEVDAAVAPNGRFLAVASSTAGIEVFSINTDPNDLVEDGSLTSLGAPIATAQPAACLEFDSSGSYLYVGLTTGGIETFACDAGGDLLSVELTTSGDGALDLALRLTVE